MANIMIIEPHALLRLGLVQLLADLGPDVTLQSQDYPVISAPPQTQWATDLVLLARGYPMKTVGRCLNISVATAKAHTETLYQRLDVHNRNAAVYAAVSRGAKLGWACMGGDADPGAANCNR
ncbi:response regulator transcription factor [Pusillimonas sp. 7-48]|uniref:Response regulator transcription factor n=1 Tax=Pusillimonas minor TaxID=2697024 RepID=A0A842HQC3_9BURK|nr:response regulator transcription factor [Pusillimonas minor]